MVKPTIEWDPLAHAVIAEQAETKARGSIAGPDLSLEACACGKFGPWGDGQAFYCEAHVPPELRFCGQFFKEIYE